MKIAKEAEAQREEAEEATASAEAVVAEGVPLPDASWSVINQYVRETVALIDSSTGAFKPDSSMSEARLALVGERVNVWAAQNAAHGRWLYNKAAELRTAFGRTL